MKRTLFIILLISCAIYSAKSQSAAKEDDLLFLDNTDTYLVDSAGRSKIIYGDDSTHDMSTKDSHKLYFDGGGDWWPNYYEPKIEKPAESAFTRFTLNILPIIGIAVMVFMFGVAMGSIITRAAEKHEQKERRKK